MPVRAVRARAGHGGQPQVGAVTPPQQGAHPGPASSFERDQGFQEKKLTLRLGKGKPQCLEDAGHGHEHGAPREPAVGEPIDGAQQ